MATAIHGMTATAHQQPSASIDIPVSRVGRRGHASHQGAMSKHGVGGLLTPPSSISPLMPAHHANNLKSPPLLNIVEEDTEMDMIAGQATPPRELLDGGGAPLSVGALSGLDARASITPSLLARDHLPAIMLGNGPQPIRHLMGELTHTLPGFSRIPPAKARRLVVAALEGRAGGGPDGTIIFCKTGWGRWDAYEKGSQGSEQSDYSPPHRRDAHTMSQSLPARSIATRHGADWQRVGSMPEGYDLEDMDMDDVVHDADNMSLDDVEGVFSSSEGDDDSDGTDDDDWAAVGPQALRKASLPAPGQPAPPRTNYQALGVPLSRPSFGSWGRRFSTVSDRSVHSANISSYSPQLGPLQPGMQSPEEQVAIEALLRMGSL